TESRRPDGDHDPRDREVAGSRGKAARRPPLHRLSDRRALDQRRRPRAGGQEVMTTATTEKVNRAGFKWSDYQGLPSTLCKGCGHDNITRHIIQAYFDLGIDPHNVVKTSGIGCSSKTPAYFVHRGYGINAVHGRMPSITTGAKLANHHLQ